MARVEFFVEGVPAPQGSKSVSRQGFLYETSKKLKPWRKKVAETAPAVYIPKPGAVQVGLTFIMPRPKSTPKKTPPAVKRPDLDKLVRACLDAITGVTIEDDSQVTAIMATKRLAEPGETTGVHVRIYPI